MTVRKIMSNENKKALADVNEKASDWSGTCQKCGKTITGTLAELREHICGAPRT